MLLLLATNGGSYMESPAAPLDLTCVTLKGQSRGLPHIEALYLIKELRPYVTIRH